MPKERDVDKRLNLLCQLTSNNYDITKKAVRRLPFGANGRIRTGDLFITSELLYQLSHISK